MENLSEADSNTINPTPSPIKKRLINFWMISTFILLILLAIAVFYIINGPNYFLNDRIEPTSYVPTPTLQTPSPTVTTKMTISNVKNQQMIGENDNYAVYLINFDDSGQTPETKGEIIVLDKKNNEQIKMNGEFSIFGATIVTDDGKGKYILLSTGTYTLRGIIPISLIKKTQVSEGFCVNSKTFFWNDSVIYANCDTFSNRPWGAGEASSLAVHNLETNVEKIIMKSDLTHQYRITSVDGNILTYVETSVDNENDWKDESKRTDVIKTYDLSSL